MTEEKLEQLKYLMDECHTLCSFVEMVEELDKASDENVVDDKLKNLSEQCKRVQVSIEDFRREY